MSHSTHPQSRRSFNKTLSAMAAGSLFAVSEEVFSDNLVGPDLKIGVFRVDVTPPKGHSCCGGWIKPVEIIDDPLEAIGIVITGLAKPFALIAVDWTGICNSAHIQLRQAVAKEIGTEPTHVAIQAVHQHNAPFACLDTQSLIDPHPELPAVVDREFFSAVTKSIAKAAAKAANESKPCTEVGFGSAKVDSVASNRRILDESGKLKDWRGSASKNPAHQAAPEGLIDPLLRTISFFSGETRVAALHYYATHPMSYYGDGRVTSDFVGLARKQLQDAEHECTHIYFTGCSGNIAPGKYNDGTPESRKRLTERMATALRASDESTKRFPIRTLSWSFQNVTPLPRPEFDRENLKVDIADKTKSTVDRSRPAFTLAYLDRCERGDPLVLSCLKINDLAIVHLPAESFVEYQLAAQELGKGKQVCVAAYGDGGPWYIPTKEAYPQGGYEVSVAFGAAGIDPAFRQAIERLLI